MKCPVDNTTLVMAERSGVEIDYCPTCRGVWLDRGELDKIVQRAQSEVQSAQVLPEPPRAAAVASAPRDDDRRDRRDDYRRRDDDDDDDHHRRRYGKRRESFLSDLFDF